jgi:hypothetical protein
MTMNVYGRVRDERLWHVVEQIAEHVQCMSTEHDHADVQDAMQSYANGLPEEDTCEAVGSIPAASTDVEEL